VADDPRVVWLGRIDDEERNRRMRGADAFCAPSLRGESFGVVLLEAMAARTPVVASDLPGYANVARPGREGLLVPPGDADALGAALRTVLEGGQWSRSWWRRAPSGPTSCRWTASPPLPGALRHARLTAPRLSPRAGRS
jgi:glycosyltransferase involved in cell wall biosynthesis